MNLKKFWSFDTEKIKKWQMHQPSPSFYYNNSVDLRLGDQIPEPDK
jgi:hypothetical protein